MGTPPASNACVDYDHGAVVPCGAMVVMRRPSYALHTLLCMYYIKPMQMHIYNTHGLYKYNTCYYFLCSKPSIYTSSIPLYK
jgi:hypothetical protein